jgi:hypothetical protein
LGVVVFVEFGKEEACADEGFAVAEDEGGLWEDEVVEFVGPLGGVRDVEGGSVGPLAEVSRVADAVAFVVEVPLEMVKVVVRASADG